MRKHLIAVFVGSALILPTFAFAESTTQTQKSNNDLHAPIGFGSGMVAGAIVAGPVGAIVGGVTGLLIGDNVATQKELASTNEALSGTQTELAKLESEYKGALELAKLKQQQLEQVRLVSLEEGLEEINVPVETNIQFKTASFELEPHYQKQLETIAMGIKEHAEAQIMLEGFADRRGDQNYNRELSKQRVGAVKQFLVQQGVSEQLIQTSAFGEERPVADAQTLENDFFDRRVKLTVEKGISVLTASHK